MELYSGVTSGIGKLIMLGELDPTKTNVLRRIPRYV